MRRLTNNTKLEIHIYSVHKTTTHLEFATPEELLAIPPTTAEAALHVEIDLPRPLLGLGSEVMNVIAEVVPGLGRCAEGVRSWNTQVDGGPGSLVFKLVLHCPVGWKGCCRT